MAKLDKPIIHFQLPHDENGEPTVEFACVEMFKALIEREMGGDKAYLLFTPYDIDVIGAEVEKVKVDEITLEEFLKKHDIKDGAGE